MFADLLYSVEDAWGIWLGSCAVLSLLVYRSIRSRPWRCLAMFLRDERGASYAFPYLMTFPLYLITVCWVIQSTMILIVKIGVMHSAHTAARSAVVWRCAHPYRHDEGLKLAKEKAEHAAALVMTPYASGLKAHQRVYRYGVKEQIRAARAVPESYVYDRLYRRLAEHSEAKDCLAGSKFVRRKYTYARAMTNVELLNHTNRFNEKLSVRVRFRMPIHIPGTGWLLGTLHASEDGYYRDVWATATLPLETAESPDGRLGIDYDSSQL